MLYLSGHVGPEVRAVRGHPLLGFMASPKCYGPAEAGRWDAWAADNGAFGNHGPAACDVDRWARWLAALPPGARFAVSPDVPYDWPATRHLSPRHFDRIRAAGYPIAIAAQDGATDLDVPWSDIDVLFLGGSTAWKESDDAHRLADAAHHRGLTVHMGRVNSLRRLRIAASWAVDSVDGNLLGYGARENLAPLLRWLEDLASGAQLALMLG